MAGGMWGEGCRKGALIAVKALFGILSSHLVGLGSSSVLYLSFLLMCHLGGSKSVTCRGDLV